MSRLHAAKKEKHLKSSVCEVVAICDHIENSKDFHDLLTF